MLSNLTKEKLNPLNIQTSIVSNEDIRLEALVQLGLSITPLTENELSLFELDVDEDSERLAQELVESHEGELLLLDFKVDAFLSQCLSKNGQKKALMIH
ncbi:hypothetical protein L1267_10790 [Pseudoalteromonas sp. OFAV1]|jgi:hypothetical protein|uniref:hypothetical protein n=1 Tax=Pseudoalteromonas sp. OFAV1 TaxID=2908892 RepID=UPI001F2432B4|nr:hypothetical protein [Pseudoalteromonas sp. OFAV1]MCF2900889.1 hypothetical protein [Pseudoalteromonas sp. OFAV1]